MSMTETSGIIIPSITPFTAEDKIDFAAAEKLTHTQIKAQSTGFYVGGSTGEGLLQSVNERRDFLSCIAQVATGKLLIAQVGAMSLRDAIELAEHAAISGYHYISSTPPFYFAYTPDDVIGYYSDLAAASPLPLILYNTPATTGKSLSIKQMEKLLDHPNISGVKYTDTNMFPLQQIIASRPSGLYYNGPDEMLLAGLSLGCRGGIGSTYNVLTSLWVKLFNAFKQKDMENALALQNEANNYIRILLEVSPSVIPGIKASLNILGHNVGACRKPLPTLSQDAIKKLEQSLASIDKYL